MANWPGDAFVPAPVRGIVRFGSEAFEVTTRLPLAFPADCGEKMTLNITCCPGASTTGGVNPLMLNPVPLMAACEIVTVDDPLELVRVSESGS
jgi:hypothetical protein